MAEIDRLGAAVKALLDHAASQEAEIATLKSEPVGVADARLIAITTEIEAIVGPVADPTTVQQPTPPAAT